MNRTPFAIVLILFLAAPAARAADSLQTGDYLAVIGDSITEQKLYSVFIEDYLLMCQPAADLRQTQFGWGGETSWGFAARMDNDMLRFQPTAITTCYGMNDGGYSPMTPEKAQHYRDNQRQIVERAKQAKVRLIVVGSPGCVDADTFHKKPAEAEMYNKTLAAERDIAREVAQSEGVAFANVYDPMIDVMTKAKAKYGRKYHLAGGDGIHPDRNGHLVMAYAFLKGLGCSGDIGRITVDLKANQAEATLGHKVLSCRDGVVELESTRYPFCFYGDPAQTSSTRGVLEFLPFNQDLNRLTLVVKEPAGRCKVTWGTTSKEFSAEQLSNGINLAAEFLDNPFSEPFQQVENVIHRQQEFETPLVKNLLHSIPDYKRAAPDASDSLEQVATGCVREDKELISVSSSAVKPVRHKIVIRGLGTGG
ncbi:MAG TPA: SGNH/GDSL hydrolase family protein [Pirellulales bacterium]|nr:SGNH/GDSL hydrolase family protein [Pirellulales bacterium]